MRRFLPTFAFLVVILSGLVWTLVHAVQPAVRERLAAYDWSAVLDNQLTRAVDEVVVAAVPSAPWLNGVADGLRYRLLADAGPQVRVGCPGWLFLAEEVLEQPDGLAHLRDRVRLAGLLAADLAHRGVALVVLPVPDKVRLAAAQSCDLSESEQSTKRLELWRRDAAEPVRGVDLAAGWPVPGFWRTDTHWDRVGARAAAERSARDILPLLAGAPSEHVLLETSPGVHPRPGDLSRLAGLEHGPAWLLPAPDLEQDQHVVVERSGGLLDEPPAPAVILTGSSYSLNSGFLDYLEVALQLEVIQRSEAGGGFAGALLKLLKGEPGLVAQVKVVLWEWPERSLTPPLSDAEHDYLEARHER